MIWTKDDITRRQNPMVKWASSLSQKKAREEEGAFLAEGEKLLAEALDAALPILAILVRSDRREAIFSLLSRYDGLPLYAKTEVVLLSETAFDKISTENSPQGVICVIKHLDFCKYFDIIYKNGKIKH